jgi:hypothetical protein
MACAWIGNRILTVVQISYFLLSVMSVLVLSNNFSYKYSPTNAVDTSRKIPRASQFSLKSELIFNMVNCLYVCYTRQSSWNPDSSALLTARPFTQCSRSLQYCFAYRNSLCHARTEFGNGSRDTECWRSKCGSGSGPVAVVPLSTYRFTTVGSEKFSHGSDSLWILFHWWSISPGKTLFRQEQPRDPDVHFSQLGERLLIMRNAVTVSAVVLLNRN